MHNCAGTPPSPSNGRSVSSSKQPEVRFIDLGKGLTRNYGEKSRPACDPPRRQDAWSREHKHAEIRCEIAVIIVK